MSTATEGIQEWKHGDIDIFRLHYSASPGTIARAEAAKRVMSPDSYRQEYEIDFSAKLGTRLFHFEDSATLCNFSPIPHEWTRYFALDPHPRVPHAFLWIAVDPWNDAYAYRELWPSLIYGTPGNVPEDDNRYRVRDYIETVKFLESADNEENQKQAENIHNRVIDYAARGFYGTTDDDDQRNIQQRYEDTSRLSDISYPLIFSDAIKDRDAGVEMVNDYLKPRDIYAGTKMLEEKHTKKSKLHIFEDKCPELLYQLRNNRWESLTPQMADKRDPSSKVQQKRNHLTDCLRYLVMHGLEFVNPHPSTESTWSPLARGVAY